MSATFAGRLAAVDDHRSLRLYVEVAGIPDAFIEQDATASTWTGIRSSQIRCITSVEQGEVQLDMLRRRATGGSLTVRMQDDASGTLRALFTPRARRTTWISSSCSDVDTSISLNSGSGIDSANDTIYVGGETILGGDGGTSTFSVTTRGAYGSEAQAHFGGTENGASVYTSPPTWVGRRVTLCGYFISQPNGATTVGGLKEVLGTFVVEEAPAYIGNGQWELRCGDIAEQIARRKVGKGIRPISVAAPIRSTTRWVHANTEATDNPVLLPTSTDASLYWRIKIGESVFFTKYYDRVSTSVYFDATGARFDAEARNSSDSTDWTGSLCVILNYGFPGENLLTILTSRLGDATNGIHDRLPGTARSGFGGDSLQLGAGIPSTEIDFGAFTSAGDSGILWTYIIDKEISLGEVLEDWCTAVDAVWYVDRDGVLTCKPMHETDAASVLTVDTSVVVGEAKVRHDEENIFPRVTLECDYNPFTQKFMDTMNIVDEELQARYPAKEEALSLRSRSVRVQPSSIPTSAVYGYLMPALPSMSIEDVRMMLRRIMTGNGRGRLVVSCECTIEALQAYIGDTVSITLADVPDYAGSTVSGSGVVVGFRPDYDRGRVELSVQMQETLYAIAPAAVIQSVPAGWTTGGPYRIDLLSTGYENVDANPENMFAVGWDVYIYATSARTDSYTGLPVVEGDVTVCTISSISALRLTFTGGSFPGSFVPLANDFVTVFEQTGATSSPTNTDGYARTSFAYQMADNLASVDFVTRWR